jgi:hypothetical protein
MITKDQLLESMVRDCDIAQHLYTKVQASDLEYRPSRTQRSTLELLQYLSVCGIAGATCMVENNWDLFGKYSARAQQMEAPQFPAAMVAQRDELKQLFDSLGDTGLTERQGLLPGGGLQPLGVALLQGPAKWLTAYKMQLFLYAKATGAIDIGTANAWGGVDAKPRS